MPGGLYYAASMHCRTVGGVTKTVVLELRRHGDGNVTSSTTETTSADNDVRLHHVVVATV